MTVDVKHDGSRRRFVVDLGDGDEAYLDYEERENDVLDYTSTFVPEAHRGRGIAEQLVVTALEWAREAGREVVPSCPYVNHVVQDVHPRFRSLVAPDA
ncbi:MAG: GNAT family N-acetyltransferase [Candidatus Palauibacterales bacterium]|nr:GNAT family N-acetyltransferase [Candidatus Palauibacterales bacterium]